MSGRAVKADRRKVRKVLGDGAPVLLEAHEDGLKYHAAILRASVLGGFWRRVRWFAFGFRRPGIVGRLGVPTDAQ